MSKKDLRVDDALAQTIQDLFAEGHATAAKNPEKVWRDKQAREDATPPFKAFDPKGVSKSFGAPADSPAEHADDLAKGARGGAYHRRVSRPEEEGGGFRYYYDPATYQRREEPHVSGAEAASDYLDNRVKDFMGSAGEDGCPKAEFAALVKKHGPEKVTQSLLRACPGGVTEREGRLFAKSEEERWLDPDELLSKGRGLPVGSERQWGNARYRKERDGEWVRISRPRKSKEKRAPAPETPAYAALPWREEPLPGHIPSRKYGEGGEGTRGGTEEMHWDGAAKAYTPARQALHTEIVAKAFKGKTPAHKGERMAIVMMGGTASGKSTMLEHSGLGEGNFVHVDADEIKKKLPEYRDAIAAKYRSAAAMAHQESSTLARHLTSEAVEQGYNVVLDGTGADAVRFKQQLQALRDQGYHIHLMMPDQDKGAAVSDAVRRAEWTGRWVPPDFIEYAYGQIPYNFKEMASFADSAELYDRRQSLPDKSSRLVWEKRGPGDETAHDATFWAGYPEAQHGEQV